MTNTLKQIFLSSRPISWVNTAYPFAAAYLVITGNIDIIWLVGALYFLIPYNVLMYGINDVFDYESDMQNARKNGLEGIALDKRYHRPIIFAVLILNIPFLVYLWLQGSMAANIVLLFVIFAQLAYTVPGLRFKEKPLLDSLTSATHFVGPLLYAMVLVGWQPSYWIFVLSFFLWAMASHMFGAVQDIIPDRKAGIGSIATIVGAKTTVWLAILLYLLSGLLLAVKGGASLFVAPLALLYILNIWPYRNLSNKNSALANKGWRRFISLNYVSGFVITLVLIYISL